MKPSILHTIEFVQKHLDASGARVIEVGSGTGELAAQLLERGYDVQAVDGSEDAVAQARARGVSALVGRWPDCDVPDAPNVLFTRSLHHMHDLEAAVDKAAEIAGENGRIFVEDFAFADADQPTIRWFASLARALTVGSKLAHDDDSFLRRVAEAPDPISAWGQTSHHIHSAAAMREALLTVGELRHEERTPYLFRYVEAACGATEATDALAAERTAAAAGRITLIGRRWVVRVVR